VLEKAEAAEKVAKVAETKAAVVVGKDKDTKAVEVLGKDKDKKEAADKVVEKVVMVETEKEKHDIVNKEE